jgi:putative ABC transport system permease protein
MHVFRLLTLRSLRARSLRILLSMFGIVLGVAGILAIGATNLAAMASIDQLFKDSSGKASLVITATGSSDQGFAERLVRRVRARPEVAAATGVLQTQTVLADADQPQSLELSFFGASSGGLSLYGIDPALDARIREYRLVAGSFLDVDNADAREMVLVDRYAEEHEIAVGKSIEIITPNGPQRLKVVGLMAKEGPGQLNNGAFAIVPLQTAQELFNRAGKIDQIDIVVTPEQNNLEALDALKGVLQQALGPDYSVTYPAMQGRRMTQMLNNYQIGLNFMSGMSLFVGAFLIYNAFSMTVVERTREFGFLRTVGMTRRQVTLQVLVEATVLGLLGVLLGLGLGLLLARGLTALMGVLLARDLGTPPLPADLLATGVMLGLMVTLLAALMPAVQAGRIAPLEALRVRGIRREGWLMRKGWLPGAAMLLLAAVILLANPFPYDVQFRLGSVIVIALFSGATLLIPASIAPWERLTRPVMRRLYGPSGQLGSANIKRSQLRTTLTIAALMVGVAMIVIVRSMTDSFKGDLDSWINAYIGGDMYISSSTPLRRSLGNSLESVEGVAAVAPVRYLEARYRPAGRTSEEMVSFMAIDPAAHVQVTSFVFSDSDIDATQALARLAQGDAVFLSSVLSEKYGLRQGDSIRLRTANGVHDVAIAAVVVDFYNQGLVVTGSWNDMRRYFGAREASAFMLKVAPGYDVESVRDRIEAQFGKREHLVIMVGQSLRANVATLMNQAFSMFDVVALIALIVASLGIVNTLTISVMERTQEIGMLRSIGMTRRQVVRMVLAEAAMLGLIGGVLGLAFGLMLARIFLLAMTAMSGYRLTYSIPLGAIVIGLMVALLVSQLAAALPAQRAARTRILEAIHYE